jgi:hypothetical protein
MTYSEQRISEWSQRLGGDGHLALYYTPGARRPWKAVTTIDRPRRRGRYLEALGSSPDDALKSLLGIMPAVHGGR